MGEINWDNQNRHKEEEHGRKKVEIEETNKWSFDREKP